MREQPSRATAREIKLLKTSEIALPTLDPSSFCPPDSLSMSTASLYVILKFSPTGLSKLQENRRLRPETCSGDAWKDIASRPHPHSN
eukprot:767137-Hanusia_phi.AAC.14